MQKTCGDTKSAECHGNADAGVRHKRAWCGGRALRWRTHFQQVEGVGDCGSECDRTVTDGGFRMPGSSPKPRASFLGTKPQTNMKQLTHALRIALPVVMIGAAHAETPQAEESVLESAACSCGIAGRSQVDEVPLDMGVSFT